MRLGLFFVGIMLIVGGIAGIRSKSQYRDVEHRGVTIDLPSEKREEPLDSRTVDSKVAGWSAVAAGALVLGVSILSKGLRVPKPHNQPPVESQPYV